MIEKKVLITDRADRALQSGLLKRGFKVDDLPDISYEQVLRIIGDYSGIVINTKTPARKELLSRASKLEWIARLGSGLDIVDLERAKERGIAVINSPEGNANAVGEHVLGMLLALLRNICIADREVRKCLWNREKNRGRELSSMQVGIIGFGNTGTAFASLLQGFGCRIYAYDKYKRNYAQEWDHVVECNSAEEVLREVDIVSFHLPLTVETHAMADWEFFSQCKRGCIVINSSRGKILRTTDLLSALESGQLGGACLDVFENEKPDTYTAEEEKIYGKLFERSDVVLSPHIAGWTGESKVRIAEVILKKLDEAK